MKITIGGKIEREIAIAKAKVEQIPLKERRARVLELVARNRRSRFRLIAGGLPPRD